MVPCSQKFSIFLLYEHLNTAIHKYFIMEIIEPNMLYSVLMSLLENSVKVKFYIPHELNEKIDKDPLFDELYKTGKIQHIYQTMCFDNHEIDELEIGGITPIGKAIKKEPLRIMEKSKKSL